jgi:ribosomal protein S13
MAKKTTTIKVVAEQIEGSIHVIRGQRVMLDSDLAGLYGVPTKRLNEQVARNRKRFPDDFAFQLTEQEVANLKSQIATSKVDAVLRSQIATSNDGRGGRRYRPWAFTEHGVAMLSSVLRSPMAVQVNIEIMRAFVRIRRLLATPGELVAQVTKLAETLQLHDDQIKMITEVLRKMMEPPPESPKKQIGFHTIGHNP